MEMTMKNLGLTIIQVERELKENHNSPAAKTLMNTYQNLLGKFNRLPQRGIKEIDLHEDELKKHKGKLGELLSFTEKAISTCLINREYKNADRLVLVGERIENPIGIINNLFYFRDKAAKYSLNNVKHRTSTLNESDQGKPKTKERVEVIVVLKNTHELKNSYTMFKNLLGDKVIDKSQNFTPKNSVSLFELKTDSHRIRFFKDSINLLQGQRADYIINLSNKKEIEEYFGKMNKL